MRTTYNFFGYCIKENTFYDVNHPFNSDIFNVNSDFDTLARVYFRLDPTQINHTRFEYDIAAFLGDVGGIYELLFLIAFLIMGGFMAFNASMEIMKELSNYVYGKNPTKPTSSASHALPKTPIKKEKKKRMKLVYVPPPGADPNEVPPPPPPAPDFRN